MVGAHVPATKVRDLRRGGRTTLMGLLTGMVAVGSRPRPVDFSEGTGRARLCAHVTYSTLNSAVKQESRDKVVEDRANATSSA